MLLEEKNREAATARLEEGNREATARMEVLLVVLLEEGNREAAFEAGAASDPTGAMAERALKVASSPGGSRGGQNGG